MKMHVLVEVVTSVRLDVSKEILHLQTLQVSGQAEKSGQELQEDLGTKMGRSSSWTISVMRKEIHSCRVLKE
jgi:hypothetical protein